MYLFFAAVVFIFWVSVFITTILLKRAAKRFDETKTNAKAEVVGYDTSEGARWRSLIVKLNDVGDDRKYIVNSGKIDIRDYPHGTTVDVIYATSLLGRQVYLKDKMPVSQASMLRAFNNVAWVLFILMVALVGTGIISLLMG